MGERLWCEHNSPLIFHVYRELYRALPHVLVVHGESHSASTFAVESLDYFSSTAGILEGK